MILEKIKIILHFSDDVLRKEDGPETLLALFDDHGFGPTEFGEASRSDWSAMVAKELSAGPGGLFHFYADGLSVSFVSVARDIAIRSSITVSVSPDRSDLSRLRGLVTALCSKGQILDGFGHDRCDFAISGDPRVEEPYDVVGVHDAYWLLVLGRKLVTKLGKKRVLSTPSFQVDELPDGGVVIFTTESPLEPTSLASRKAQAEALSHLAPEHTVKQSLARYAKRDAALAPVAKDWNPEIAPLYNLIVDWFGDSGAERLAKIRELNARKLPAVSELRAKPLAENAKPMKYKTRADDLVAILHDKVRGLGATPSSKLLPALDFHFYNWDYPEEYGDAATQTLLEPLGCWLGEVMRLELGGTWVPRAKLEENQLVVGKIAYLPFQRVAHFLASKDAAIDYSLTRYFAHVAAER